MWRVTAAETDPQDSYDPQKLDNQLEPVAGKNVAGLQQALAPFVTRKTGVREGVSWVIHNTELLAACYAQCVEVMTCSC